MKRALPLRRAFGVVRIAVAPLLIAVAGTAGAASARAIPEAWRTECTGYYTMRLPAQSLEYAAYRIQKVPGSKPGVRLSDRPGLGDGWGAQAVDFYVDGDGASNFSRGGARSTRVKISQLATRERFEAVIVGSNAAIQRGKDDLLWKAKLFNDDDQMRQAFIQQAIDLDFFKPFNSGTVYALQSDVGTGLFAWIDGHIVNVGRKSLATPQETIDTFLRNYRPRAAFEVPAEPGVCLPYAFMAHEIEPASVAMSMQLKERPDIVVYLRDAGRVDTTTDRELQMRKFERTSLRVSDHFAGAVDNPKPLDAVRPFRSITIDGNEGRGIFVTVKRSRNGEGSPEQSINNEANNDEDWGYVAYVPGNPNAPEGMSSDLTFRVERCGRFAKQSMTEKEFRELVKAIASSITRRPGACVRKS